eukprot:scaffold555_cov109-Isochrysis_galbana.AAC.10
MAKTAWADCTRVRHPGQPLDREKEMAKGPRRDERIRGQCEKVLCAQAMRPVSAQGRLWLRLWGLRDAHPQEPWGGGHSKAGLQRGNWRPPYGAAVNAEAAVNASRATRATERFGREDTVASGWAR